MLAELTLTAALSLAPCTLSYAIDGDTVACSYPDGNTAHARLTGYDTPEIHGHCLEERVRAVAAWRRLSAIIKSREQGVNVTLTIPGPDCRYGRLCGTLTSGGVYVRAILIEEGPDRHPH